MIVLKPRTELKLSRDPRITCRTIDEVNQVEYDGAIPSLSDAALKAYASLGLDSVALSGPWEWTYDGKRLDDIRRSIEEATD